MTMQEDVKIGENEKAIFWTNMFCHKYDDGFSIIVAEEKSTGYKEYLLLENGVPVASNTNIEAIYYRHDAMARAKLP